MTTPEKDSIVADQQDRVFVRAAFGRRVRELRKARGYSQERFAMLSGLDRSYFGGVERGERNVSLDNIAAIARALDVPIKKLFPSEDTPPDP